eukprot:1446031-Alexandrium_andersonii.AAC.1
MARPCVLFPDVRSRLTCPRHATACCARRMHQVKSSVARECAVFPLRGFGPALNARFGQEDRASDGSDNVH